jgi:ubiquinone/menaquinone biosynthesis C-methylase UbiE
MKQNGLPILEKGRVSHNVFNRAFGVKSKIRENNLLQQFWAKQTQSDKKVSQYCYRITLERLPKLLHDWRGKRVLDIGIGFGDISFDLDHLEANVTGVDICFECIKFLSDEGILSCQADARQLPFEDCEFDLVYSLGVIEHFNDTARAVTEHIRVLKPGGKALIVVPNLFSPYALSWIWHLLMRNKVSFQTVGKRYTVGMVRRMLEKSGFINISISVCFCSIGLAVFPINYDPQLAVKIDNLGFLQKFGHWIWATGSKPI